MPAGEGVGLVRSIEPAAVVTGSVNRPPPYRILASSVEAVRAVASPPSAPPTATVVQIAPLLSLPNTVRSPGDARTIGRLHERLPGWSQPDAGRFAGQRIRFGWLSNRFP